MFKIEDGREFFYQWDLDRRLVVNDDISEVHFCNRTDDCSLVCETYVEDGIRLVNVPNIVLQNDFKIRVYGYDKKYTKYEKCFEVQKRTKPSDYAYAETEILNWSKIEERVDAALEEIKEVEEVAELVLKNAQDATENAINATTGLNEIVQEAISSIDNANDAANNAYSAGEEANKAVAEMNTTFANALKGEVKDSFVSLDDVSPLPHNVNVEVYSKNLINLNNAYVSPAYHTITVEDNKLIYSAGSGSTVGNIYIPVGDYQQYAGKTLTLKVNFDSITTSSGRKSFTAYIFKDSSELLRKTITLDANNNITFTAPEDEEADKLIVRLYIGYAANTMGDTATLSNIQLEEGAVATDYTPYADISNATVKVCGRNLFDAQNFTYTSQNDRCVAENIGEGNIRVVVNKAADFMNANVFVMKTYGIKPDTYIYANTNVEYKTEEGNTPTIALYMYNTSTKTGKTLHSTKVISDNGRMRAAVKLTEDNIKEYDEIRLLLYYNASSTTGWIKGNYVDYKNIVVNLGTEAEYEKYVGTEYTPEEDIAAIYPAMNIQADKAGVMFDVEYNRDINKAFAELQQVIISLGGNI